MLVLVGAWLVILGYGLAFAGTSRINGKRITLREAFSTQPPTTSSGADAYQQRQVMPGLTSADRQTLLQQQQTSTIPDTVIGPR